MFAYRNKAHNAAQLMVVMADVYNNYLRLRLSDVIFKKESFSKKVSSTIPSTAVTHKEGAQYSVRSGSQEGIEYNVDLSIGICSCLAGNTGSVCKHQLAASEYSATRLPQLHTCSPVHKRLLFKVIYGEKALPTETFFDGLIGDASLNVVAEGN